MQADGTAFVTNTTLADGEVQGRIRGCRRRAEPYPLWVGPDEGVSVNRITALLRFAKPFQNLSIHFRIELRFGDVEVTAPRSSSLEGMHSSPGRSQRPAQ